MVKFTRSLMLLPPRCARYRELGSCCPCADICQCLLKIGYITRLPVIDMRCLVVTNIVWFPMLAFGLGSLQMASEHDPFLQALGVDEKLPEAIQKLHSAEGHYSGRCSIIRGRGPLVALALRIGGFPPEGDDLQITLTIRRTKGHWIWKRDFSGHETCSRISFDRRYNCVHERIGGLAIWLQPVRTEAGLSIQIRRLALFGIPCPKFLLPQSASTETQDSMDRFCFDISAYVPGLGLLIRYSGWLEPDRSELRSV